MTDDGAWPAPGPRVWSGDLRVRRASRRGGLVQLEFDVPAEFSAARAGQFAFLSSNRAGAPLLGRPISIIRTDTLSFAFAVVGAGTRSLAGTADGEAVFVTGPLGHPFNAAADATLIVCDASHFGTFLALAKERRAAGAPADCIFVREAGPAAVFDEDVLALLRPAVGTLSAVPLGELPQTLAARRQDVIAAGARDPVMAAVQHHAAETDSIAEASLQAPMACGLGVCKVCIRPRRAGGTMLVCEGPVSPIGTPAFAA